MNRTDVPDAVTDRRPDIPTEVWVLGLLGLLAIILEGGASAA